MKTYIVMYKKTYKDTFEIKADSKREAEKKLLNLIINKKLKNPKICIDSHMEIIDVID